MGPLHSFRDTQHLNELLTEVRSRGIKVTPVTKRSASEAFWFRRGLGLVHGGVGFGEMKSIMYFGFGHPFNPLLWYSDNRLLKSIQKVFTANGSEVVDVDGIAKPGASLNDGPAA